MARRWLLGLLILLGTVAGAQEAPGLKFWDARTALIVLGRTEVLLVQEPGKPPRNLWIRSLHVRPTPEGYWAIQINGTDYDWRTLYLNYGGRLVNLSLAFQYANEVRDHPERWPRNFEFPLDPQDGP